MKIIFKIYFLFLIICSSSFAQEKCTLSGEIKFCTYPENTYGKPFKLSKDNQIINPKVIPNNDGEFEVFNLQKGVYAIEFENIFGQIIKKKVKLESSETKINLCLDEFIDSNMFTLFNALKDDDKIRIKINGSGCFHSFEDEIIFYRKNGDYYGETYNLKKKKIKKKLNTEEIKYIVIWEKQARSIENVDGFCTSSVAYEFSLNDVSKLKIFDSTCNWDGYTQIRKKIFNL